MRVFFQKIRDTTLNDVAISRIFRNSVMGFRDRTSHMFRLVLDNAESIFVAMLRRQRNKRGFSLYAFCIPDILEVDRSPRGAMRQKKRMILN